MKKILVSFFVCALTLLTVVFTTGCEVNVNSQETSDGSTNTQDNASATTTPASNSAPTTTSPPATTTPPPVTTPMSGLDEINIAGTKTLGEHADIRPQEAAITRALYSANKEGENVRMKFQSLGWSTRKTNNGKTIDGSVHIFWYKGSQLVGGMFDWHGVGQEVKTLHNVYDGYLGDRPPAGATIYFCLVSLDERQRTNVTKSDTTW